MKSSKKKIDTFCICSCAIFFFGFDFQTVGTNLQTFGNFSAISYISIKFYDIFGFKLIFLDIVKILNIYQLILAHKGDKMRFLTFILIEYTKVRVLCFYSFVMS